MEDIDDDVNQIFATDDESTNKSHIIAQFFTTDDQPTGTKLDLPLNITSDQLQLLINQILKNVTLFNFFFFFI